MYLFHSYCKLDVLSCPAIYDILKTLRYSSTATRYYFIYILRAKNHCGSLVFGFKQKSSSSDIVRGFYFSYFLLDIRILVIPMEATFIQLELFLLSSIAMRTFIGDVNQEITVIHTLNGTLIYWFVSFLNLLNFFIAATLLVTLFAAAYTIHNFIFVLVIFISCFFIYVLAA